MDAANIITQGIHSVKCAKQIFSVVFDPYEISEKEIEKILALNNFSIKQPGRNFFKRQLEKLAEDNKKNLGNNRLTANKNRNARY